MVVINIHVEYDELESVYTKLAQQAEEADVAIRSCMTSLEQLQSGAWIGRGATAFYGEMDNDILPAYNRLHEALNFGNDMVRLIHSVIQQAEDDGRIIFERWSA